MPKKARVLVPNYPHHIVQRGHNRKAVFLIEDDYRYYLENLKQFKTTYGIKIYAYCLMTNHVHLLVEPPDDATVLSRMMKRLAGRQAACINKREARSGALWGGRFKASPVDRECYLLACSRYIDLNPVKARMVFKPEDYPWSSYRKKAGYESMDWLDTDSCFDGLGSPNKDRCVAYQEFVGQGTPSVEQKFIAQALQRNQLTGDDLFIDEIEQCLGFRIEHRERGRPVRT